MRSACVWRRLLSRREELAGTVAGLGLVLGLGAAAMHSFSKGWLG